METTASSVGVETASSLAELREGFAGVSGKKIFVNFETIGGGDRLQLSSRPSEARAGTHNHQCLSCDGWNSSSLLQLLPVVMGPRFRGDDIRFQSLLFGVAIKPRLCVG